MFWFVLDIIQLAFKDRKNLNPRENSPPRGPTETPQPACGRKSDLIFNKFMG
jgi:hypothetical protein